MYVYGTLLKFPKVGESPVSGVSTIIFCVPAFRVIWTAIEKSIFTFAQLKGNIVLWTDTETGAGSNGFSPLFCRHLFRPRFFFGFWFLRFRLCCSLRLRQKFLAVSTFQKVPFLMFPDAYFHSTVWNTSCALSSASWQQPRNP